MDSRFRKLDTLSLDEVENEIETMFSIVNPDTMSDNEFNYINKLIGLAKALGSKVEH